MSILDFWWHTKKRQNMTVRGGAEISTELGHLLLVDNILHGKKTDAVSYFCSN